MRGSWGNRLDDIIDELHTLIGEVQESTLGVDTGTLICDVGDLQEVISAASAVQSVRLAQYAARGEERSPDGSFNEMDLGVGNVADFAADMVGPVLALPPSMAVRRVSISARLASVLPMTLRALADGFIDPFRAQIIAEETLLADRRVCAGVEERVFPVDPEETPGRLRRRVRRALAAVDPQSVAEHAARARQRLFVHVRACDVPGVSEWFAQLPTEDSAACWAAINDAVHRAKAENPSRGIDLCRAEALVDLILGRISVNTTVSIAVPVQRWTSGAGTDRHDGGACGSVFEQSVSGTEVPGIGVITGDVVDDLIARFGVSLAGMLVDAETGVTVATTGSPLYRPPAKIAQFVRQRDGTCRFPGCTVAVRRCDLDHVKPWAVGDSGSGHFDAGRTDSGKTEPANLICLCRRHHRLKTHTRWKSMLDPLSAVVT